MRRRRAVTPVDLLVGTTTLAILLGLCVLSLGWMKPDHKRQKCASNLHGFCKALYIYAQDAPETFPAVSVVRQENDGAMILFDAKTRKNKPSTTGIPSPTVDLWVLLRSRNAAPECFICPATKDKPDPARDATAYYDFASAENLSYAYQYQHDPNRPAIGPTSDPSLPLMADGNPYIKGRVKENAEKDRKSPSKGNSTNHGMKKRPGQNVLYIDSHVNFEKSPDVGLPAEMTSQEAWRSKDKAERDNIYTVGDKDGRLDPGEAPTATKCNLASKSDGCLVP